MKCMFGVLAVASLCVARPEADPALLLTHPANAVPLPLAAHPAPLLAHPAPVLAHSVQHVVPAPVLAHAVAPVFPTAHSVAHLPLVKSVVEVPAEVSHEVVAHHVPAPFFHHAPLAHHVAPLAHHVAPVALSTGALHVVTPHVNLGRKRREAEAEAEAEADPYADAYFYSSVSTPYASYGSFVPDAIPHHPVIAHVDAPVAHGHSRFGYYGHPYAGFYHGGYPYYG